MASNLSGHGHFLGASFELFGIKFGHLGTVDMKRKKERLMILEEK
jgi:hypothetical protein